MSVTIISIPDFTQLTNAELDAYIDKTFRVLASDMWEYHGEVSVEDIRWQLLEQARQQLERNKLNVH